MDPCTDVLEESQIRPCQPVPSAQLFRKLTHTRPRSTSPPRQKATPHLYSLTVSTNGANEQLYNANASKMNWSGQQTANGDFSQRSCKPDASSTHVNQMPCCADGQICVSLTMTRRGGRFSFLLTLVRPCPFSSLYYRRRRRFRHLLRQYTPYRPYTDFTVRADFLQAGIQVQLIRVKEKIYVSSNTLPPAFRAFLRLERDICCSIT
jgi:hypothetical protein